MMKNKYSYKSYSKKYPILFQREKAKLKKILPKTAKIKHIGSTAVKNLGGKGIIDIMVGANKTNINKIKSRLQKSKYIFKPKAGDKERLFFEKDYKYVGKIRRIHIQLTYYNSKIWKDAISFVEYLKKNSVAVREYSKIKKRGIRIARGERKRYREYKKKFFEKVLG